jgi:hypothetical protein
MSCTEADAASHAATVAAVASPGSASSASGSSGTAGIAALLADAAGPANSEQLGDAIARLKGEQDAVRADRKRVSKELKNAQKRKQRLKKRAKQLSDTDLVSVLQLRASEKAAVAVVE